MKEINLGKIIPRDGKDGRLIASEEIRNKLESLQGEERLDKSAIKGLEEIEKLAKQPKILGGGGGSIARNFYQLFDVPQSYAGEGGKVVSVKSDATGLEFVTGLSSYVPYTGATADVDLGAFNLKATRLTNYGADPYLVDPGLYIAQTFTETSGVVTSTWFDTTLAPTTDSSATGIAFVSQALYQPAVTAYNLTANPLSENHNGGGLSGFYGGAVGDTSISDTTITAMVANS